MPKNRNPEQKQEKENVTFVVCFQSHVNMRECYLPCNVLLNSFILKTSRKYTGKYPGKNKIFF